MRGLRKGLGLLALLAAAVVIGPATNKSHAEDVQDVDVALALGVDISYSMDDDEQRLQREGYIEGLTSKVVIDGIKAGVHGRIAITYYEWAGTFERKVIVPWSIIDSLESAQKVADILRTVPRRRASRTSVSGAIDFGVEQLENSPYRAIRRVIDISGDGPNNNGRPVEQARDDALAKGIVINGLPILLTRAVNNAFDIEDLDDYYADCVVGGPGSFMIQIGAKPQFADATRQKLLKEIAGIDDTPRVIRANERTKADCMIGEKLWQRRGWN